MVSTFGGSGSAPCLADLPASANASYLVGGVPLRTRAVHHCVDPHAQPSVHTLAGTWLKLGVFSKRRPRRAR
eukprot:10147509-Alexandrium_andersonii.AAC.1